MIRPQSATEILRTASNVLGERGKQYDPAGKQERSMTAIVAAFNAIYPRNLLTVHMGWQFMSLVKMVRGATKPHADSALDQVAYAALAAEEVAEQLNQPAPTKNSDAMNAALENDARLYGKQTCAEQHAADIAKVMEFEVRPIEKPTHFAGIGALISTPTEPSYASLQVSNQALAEELGKCQHWAGIQSQELKHLEAKAMAAHEAHMTCANRVHELLEHNRSLEVQLDTTHSALADFVCRFDLTKEYMTKEQVLAGQFKHNEQVANLRHTVKAQAERECLDIETINDLRTELASCKAMVDRLYSEKQGVERELEQVRRTNFNRSVDLTTLEQVHQAALKELDTVRGECISRGAQLAEARARVQRVPEPACAHNTDEPKAPRPEFVDPFDQYGDIRSPMHRLVGGADPARGGLAYPQGKDAPTPL